MKQSLYQLLSHPAIYSAQLRGVLGGWEYCQSTAVFQQLLVDVMVPLGHSQQAQLEQPTVEPAPE